MSQVLTLFVLALVSSAAAHSRRLLNVDGCITKEAYSCGVPDKVGCGENFYCPYPRVCDFTEVEKCSEETVVEEVCTGKDELVCELFQKTCGDDLFCAWNEDCIECSGDDCEEQFSCQAFNDLPKVCEDKPHFKCKDRPEHNTDPGYYGGYKYDWMSADEWNREEKCGKATCEETQHCAVAKAQECIVDPEYEELAQTAECGENTCQPGHKCKSNLKCEDVETEVVKCETIKKHSCVDASASKHENYLWKEAPEGLTSCGPYWCAEDSCSTAASTSCVGGGNFAASAASIASAGR